MTEEPRQPPPDPSHPDYRFSLANERTFLAWVRTSLAMLAAGVGVVHLPHGLGDRAARDVLGILLVVIGLYAAGISYIRWRANQEAIETGSPLPRSNSMRVLGAGLTLVALIALVLVISDS